MKTNILLTGQPKSGKSTMLNRVINDIEEKHGLLTQEIRNENTRIAFELKTHLGGSALLAHVDFQSDIQVGKYHVDIHALESLLPELQNIPENKLLYLDEIGEMQLHSPAFKTLILQYLDAPNVCIGTISMVYNDDFTETIKQRDDVILVELTEETREEKELFVRALLKKIEKAKQYANEPERFEITEDVVMMNSTHDTRRIEKVDDGWRCSCEFFAKHGICSHVIALEEVLKVKV